MTAIKGEKSVGLTLTGSPTLLLLLARLVHLVVLVLVKALW